MLDSKKIATDIILGVGGVENIVSAAHCSTRLRIVLKNDSLILSLKLTVLKAHLITVDNFK